MLDTCLHKLGHFFVGELHFAGKDFLLDAGREIICDVDASCIVAGTKNGGTADTVFLCDPVAGFLPGVVVITVVCTPSRGQRNKSKKYLKPLSNKGHAFPTVSERQGYAGDV